MKKCAVLIIVVMMIASLSSCKAIGQSSHGGEKVFSKIPSYITEITRKDLVGCWNNTPYWAAGRGDNHNFYADGTYRFGFNEMDGLNRRCYMDGAWELKGRKLTILLTSQTNLVGGKITYDDDIGYSIEGGKLEKETISPPLVQEYELTDLHYDYDVHDIH